MTFKELMKKWKADKTVRNLQIARLALYRAGYDEIGTKVTRHLKAQLNYLENPNREESADARGIDANLAYEEVA